MRGLATAIDALGQQIAILQDQLEAVTAERDELRRHLESTVAAFGANEATPRIEELNGVKPRRRAGASFSVPEDVITELTETAAES